MLNSLMSSGASRHTALNCCNLVLIHNFVELAPIKLNEFGVISFQRAFPNFENSFQNCSLYLFYSSLKFQPSFPYFISKTIFVFSCLKHQVATFLSMSAFFLNSKIKMSQSEQLLLEQRRFQIVGRVSFFLSKDGMHSWYKSGA